MSEAGTKQVHMVVGEVVRGSTGIWVILIICSIGVALGALGIILSGTTEISVWGFVLVEHPIAASVILIALSLFIVLLSIYKLIEGGRLILGSDRLQFVTARGRVLTQIPYRNISAANLVEVKDKDLGVVNKRIYIDLYDSNDPETLIKYGSKNHGCDCMIDPPEFVLAAEKLHERIQFHIQRFHAR